MARFFVDLIDSLGNIIDTEDEVFDNEEDAENYACECGEAFAEGAEVLEMCGRTFMDSDEYEYVVREDD